MTTRRSLAGGALAFLGTTAAVSGAPGSPGANPDAALIALCCEYVGLSERHTDLCAKQEALPQPHSAANHAEWCGSTTSLSASPNASAPWKTKSPSCRLSPRLGSERKPRRCSGPCGTSRSSTAALWPGRSRATCWGGHSDGAQATSQPSRSTRTAAFDR